MDPAYDPDDPCNGCGVCCDPVILSNDNAKAAFMGGVSSPEAVADPFFTEHWHIIGPHGATHVELRCDQYVDGRCQAYATRPSVCSEYPFYGRTPDDPDFDPGNLVCRYQDQVPGRRVLPLTVLRG